MTREASLSVNGKPISLDYFVAGFIDHTIGGMLGALKGTGELGTLEMSLKGGQVNIILNKCEVPLNEFANDIVRNTVTGMMSTLKGVAKIESFTLKLKR